MNFMTTLGAVSEKVEAMSKPCFDQNVGVRDITFDSLGTIKISGQPLKLQPLAQRSICTRLGIPHQYLQKCTPEVQATNLNHWIAQAKDEQLFVRHGENSVRGFFSQRFIPFDNKAVIEQLQVAGYSLDAQVQCHLDDEFLLLNLPDPAQEYQIKSKDRIQVGISIRNSEVGLSSLALSGFVLRLVCTNGMVTMHKTAGSAYRHVSHKVIAQFPAALKELASNQENEAEKFKISLQSKVEDPLATMEELNKRFMLNESERAAVEWAWPQEVGDTMFHIVNTYTRAAQGEGLASVSSYRLMAVGGEILESVE